MSKSTMGSRPQNGNIIVIEDSDDEADAGNQFEQSCSNIAPLTPVVNEAKRRKMNHGKPATTGNELRKTSWDFEAGSSRKDHRGSGSDGAEVCSPRSLPESPDTGSGSTSPNDSEMEISPFAPARHGRDGLRNASGSANLLGATSGFSASRLDRITAEFNSREALEKREELIEAEERQREHDLVEIGNTESSGEDGGDDGDDDVVFLRETKKRKRTPSADDSSDGDMTARIGSLQLDEVVQTPAGQSVGARGKAKKSTTSRTSPRNTNTGRRAAPQRPKRNPSIVAPFKELESFKRGSMVLSKNELVEVYEEDMSATTFLYIKHIIINETTGEAKIRGHELRRTRLLQGTLTRIQNELCRMIDVDNDDPRSPLIQGMVEYPMDRVYRIRSLIMTNRQWKAPGDVTFRQLPKQRGVAWAENEGLLVCRQERITYFPDRRLRENQTVNAKNQTTYRYLAADDIPEGHKPADAGLLRDHWRGDETVPGGGYYPGCVPYHKGHFTGHEGGDVFKLPPGQTLKELERIRSGRTSIINLDDDDDSNPGFRRATRAASLSVELAFGVARNSSRISIPLSPIPESGRIQSSSTSMQRFPLKPGQGQMYTYGDAFCGAGGATRGAFMAGLKPIWGFDFDTSACLSWQMNFPDAAIYEMAANTVCDAEKRKKISLQCDVLHMSPPCQFFSPAHTVPGINDEMNSAALMACDEVLKRAKPRVVTLEQTFGICQPAHILYFNTLVNMFTRNGYSINYKIVNFEEWGLAQKRQRLIVIGAGPGEQLPIIPPVTHTKDTSRNPHLLPYTAAGSLINSVPRDALNHDIESATFTQRRRSWCPNGILPRAMTTSGGGNCHPSGLRNLTLREFAVLQGFPVDHRFAGTAIKKQIGNAVPPSMARILFTTARKALEKADGVVAAAPEVIELDD